MLLLIYVSWLLLVVVAAVVAWGHDTSTEIQRLIIIVGYIGSYEHKHIDTDRHRHIHTDTYTDVHSTYTAHIPDIHPLTTTCSQVMQLITL